MDRKEYKQKINAISDKLNEAKIIAEQEKMLLSNEILSNYNLKLGDKLMCKENNRYNDFIICKAYIDVHNKVILGLSYTLPMSSLYTSLTPVKYIEVNQAIKENKDYNYFTNISTFIPSNIIKL